MKRVIRAVVFAICIIILMYTVPSIFYDMIFGKKYIDAAVANAIVNVWVIVVPCLIYLYIFQYDINIKECLKLKKISYRQIFILILIGFFIQPVSMLIGSITNLFFGDKVMEYMALLSNTSFVVMIVALAIIPAIMEEILMRGIILYDLRGLGLKSAAVLNGFIFGVMHMNFTQFFYAFVLGIVFVYIVNITGSIYSSIIIHFVINATQVILMRSLLDLGDIEGNASMSVKIGAIGFIGVISIICLPILILLFKKIKEYSV